jgi:hypothetical protein
MLALISSLFLLSLFLLKFDLTLVVILSE